jgi:hypothetical protein
MIKEFVIQNITNILIYLAIINVIGFLSMAFAIIYSPKKNKKQ